MTSKACLNKPKRTARALARAAAGALSLFAAACDEPYERWPLPEEFTRDGSGRLADLIPGDWEVICYTTPYAKISVEVGFGLADAGLSSRYRHNVPDLYLTAGEFVFAVLTLDRDPRILLLDDSNHYRFEDTYRGSRCHNVQKPNTK
jgi:hypothetical protein